MFNIAKIHHKKIKIVKFRLKFAFSCLFSSIGWLTSIYFWTSMMLFKTLLSDIFNNSVFQLKEAIFIYNFVAQTCKNQYHLSNIKKTRWSKIWPEILRRRFFWKTTEIYLGIFLQETYLKISFRESMSQVES